MKQEKQKRIWKEWEVRISSTVKIMFRNPNNRAISFCYVYIHKLNWKIMKLYQEGMIVLGIYFRPYKSEQLNLMNNEERLLHEVKYSDPELLEE